MTEPSRLTFTCPDCKMTSHHPKDAEYGYCGNCHDFTGTPQTGEPPVAKKDKKKPKIPTYTFAIVMGFREMTEQRWLEATNRLKMAFEDDEAPKPNLMRLFGYGAARAMLNSAEGRSVETGLIDSLINDKSLLVSDLRESKDPVEVLRTFIREHMKEQWDEHPGRDEPEPADDDTLPEDNEVDVDAKVEDD